ncbi:MAG: NUDIX domain-containing protein [Anaerolineales bacterium]|nr:NUDIX domain-containing protein [Anaerolineales bacterium]
MTRWVRVWVMRLLYQAARVYWRLLHPLTVGVKLLMIRDGQVLLVRHTYEAGWFLPGGGVKRRETLETAVRREAREELGATLGEVTLFGIYSHLEDKSDHVVVLVCTEFTLGEKVDPEIAAVAFFALEELPAEVSPGTAARVREYAAGLRPAALRDW